MKISGTKPDQAGRPPERTSSRMGQKDLKLFYWDYIQACSGPWSYPDFAFALATSKEHAIELIVEDFRENLATYYADPGDPGERAPDGKIGQPIADGRLLWSRPGIAEDQPGSYLHTLKARLPDDFRTILTARRCHIHYKPVGFAVKT
jgi:hypothetical protein